MSSDLELINPGLPSQIQTPGLPACGRGQNCSQQQWCNNQSRWFPKITKTSAEYGLNFENTSKENIDSTSIPSWFISNSLCVLWGSSSTWHPHNLYTNFEKFPKSFQDTNIAEMIYIHSSWKHGTWNTGSYKMTVLLRRIPGTSRSVLLYGISLLISHLHHLRKHRQMPSSGSLWGENGLISGCLLFASVHPINSKNWRFSYRHIGSVDEFPSKSPFSSFTSPQMYLQAIRVWRLLQCDVWRMTS